MIIRMTQTAILILKGSCHYLFLYCENDLIQSTVSLLNAIENNETISGLGALKVPPRKPTKSGARFVVCFI